MTDFWTNYSFILLMLCFGFSVSAVVSLDKMKKELAQIKETLKQLLERDVRKNKEE